MRYSFLTRLSLLVVLSPGIFGCPGRDYLDERREENKAECLAYGGEWDESESCTPDFQTALQAEWQSACLTDPSSLMPSRIQLKFENDKVHYRRLLYTSEACDVVSEQNDFTTAYSLSIESVNSNRVMGQRRILTTGSIPESFKDLHTVKLLDLDHISLLSRDIQLVRVSTPAPE